MGEQKCRFLFGFKLTKALPPVAHSDHGLSTPPSVVTRGVSRLRSYEVASSFAPRIAPGLAVTRRLFRFRNYQVPPNIAPSFGPSLPVTRDGSRHLRIPGWPQLAVALYVGLLGFEVTIFTWISEALGQKRQYLHGFLKPAVRNHNIYKDF